MCHHLIRMLLVLLSSMAMLGIQACGGGGGSPSQAAGNPAPPIDPGAWLTFAPNPVSITVREGQAGAISIVATSAQTIAQQLNMQIIDVGGVTVPSATRVTALSTLQYRADMQTLPTLAVGSYSGFFTVKLCTDSAAVCNAQIAGSPWNIPYTVVVQPGVIAVSHQPGAGFQSGNELNFRYSDGTLPVGTTNLVVSMGTPGANTAWRIASVPNFVTTTIFGAVLAANGVDALGAGRVQVLARPGLGIGNYTGTLAITDSRGGQTSSFLASLAVTSPSFRVTGSPGSANLGVEFAAVNGTLIAPQTVSVSLSRAEPNWWVTSSARWVSGRIFFGPTSTLEISVNTKNWGFASGRHTATLELSAPGFETYQLPVTLSLTPPRLVANISGFALGGPLGRSLAPVTGTFTLTDQTSSEGFTVEVPASVTGGGRYTDRTNRVNLALMPSADSGLVLGTVRVRARVNGDEVEASVPLRSELQPRRVFFTEPAVALFSSNLRARTAVGVLVRDSYGGVQAWTATSSQPWLWVKPSGATDEQGYSSLSLIVDADAVASGSALTANVNLTGANGRTDTLVVGFWKNRHNATSTVAAMNATGSYGRLAMSPVLPLAYAVSPTHVDTFDVTSGSLVSSRAHGVASLGSAVVAADGSMLYLTDLANLRLVQAPLNLASVGSFSNSATFSFSPRSLVATRTAGIHRVLAADTSGLATSADGRWQIFFGSGFSPDGATVEEVDFGLSGLTVLQRLSFSHHSPVVISNGRDVAMSRDGSLYFTASGAPYRCYRHPIDQAQAPTPYPGGDAYPSNVEVDINERVLCGNGETVWIHSARGVLLRTLSMPNDPGMLRVTPDGVFVVSLSGGILRRAAMP